MTTTRIAKETVYTAPIDPLQAKIARNSFMDTLRATPRKARAWVASTLRTLHLDSAARAGADGVSWVVARVMKAARFLKSLGLANLFGAVITVPELRTRAVAVAATAYSVIRKPFAWIGRGLRWAFAKIGFTAGVTAVDATTARVERAEAYVATKVKAGLAWMDAHQSHPAMQTMQGLSLGGLVARVTRVMFPQVNQAFRLGTSLALGAAYGVRVYRATRAEDKAIAKAKVVLAAVDGKTVVADAPTVAAPSVPVVRPVTWILTDTDRAEDDRSFEAPGIVDELGEKYVRLGSSGFTHSDDLESSISIVGEVQGDVVLPPVVPNVPRAAQRATRQPAKAGAKRRR